MDNIVAETQNGTITPINTEIMIEEDKDEYAKSQRCKTITIRSLKAATVLALISIIVILAVYWLNGRTLLAEFAYQKEDIRKPVFICIEVFLTIVVLISLADIFKWVITWMRSKGRYTSLVENDSQVETGMWKGVKLLSSKFNMKESLGKMKYQSLAEIGLLAKLASSKAAEGTLWDRDGSEGARENEYRIMISSGISFQGSGKLLPSHLVPVTVVITGSKNAGKTSIFNRVMYGGFSEVQADTVGLNFGLKTLTVDGSNMFNERRTLKVEAQVLDFSIRQEEILDQLPFAFNNYLVLIVVTDVMDASSMESVKPLVTRLRGKGMHFYAAAFVNKIDEAEDLAFIRSTSYQSLEGIDVFEVSAKAGDGIISSFISVISKAICIQAKSCAQNKQK